jgi:hypothetical protein
MVFIGHLLEAVSKLSVVALGPEICDSQAPRAGNGSISKRGNAASADFRVQPEGPRIFLRPLLGRPPCL